MIKADRQRSDEVQAYKAVLSEYFRGIDLLPVLVSASQRVGDVYDAANRWAFLSSSSDCFPTLGKIPESPSSLPDTIEIRTSQIGSAFGLTKLFSFSASASNAATVKLKFTDVKVRRASQMALRSALCPACDYLKPVTSGEMAPYASGQPLPIVVGTVLTAKREVFVGEVEGANLDLTASLAPLAASLPLEVINLNPAMSAALGYGSTSGCLLKSDTRLPVAIGPAFYPKLIFDRVQSSGSQADELVAVEWHDANRGASKDWLSQAAETLPSPTTTG
ncbi:hypothetical protein NKH48_18175 [Mesorhizobium sp. M1233]|uniref:hypothetical protein n=1 Tax=Mesorhizobium sp. M1233 TaxID=2957072 RepID=UPI0033352BEB